MKCMDRTAKKIVDTLSEACHVPIRDVCVLNHTDDYFKAYVHGTNWYGQHVYDKIMKTWGVVEENITMKVSPQDLEDNKYEIFDAIVLWFPYNRKLSVIKSLP